MKTKLLILLILLCHFIGCISESGDGSETACLKYDRKDFKYGDIDYDNDGCYARAEILISKSLVPVEMYPTSRCRVLRGKWLDAYSDDTLYEADSVEIDHVVALKEAYQSGANAWTSDKLTRFGNIDTIGEMVITRVSTNSKKSDLDISEWLPPGEIRQSEYALRWVKIKTTWGLTADDNEIKVIKRILGEDFKDLPIIKSEFNCQ